jgi:hypothetical protein
MGHNFADGAGNFEGYLGYRTAAAITANHRDHSACELSNSSSGAVPFSCVGSSSTAPAVFENPGIGEYQISMPPENSYRAITTFQLRRVALPAA